MCIRDSPNAALIRRLAIQQPNIHRSQPGPPVIPKLEIAICKMLQDLGYVKYSKLNSPIQKNGTRKNFRLGKLQEGIGPISPGRFTKWKMLWPSFLARHQLRAELRSGRIKVLILSSG